MTMTKDTRSSIQNGALLLLLAVALAVAISRAAGCAERTYAGDVLEDRGDKIEAPVIDDARK